MRLLLLNPNTSRPVTDLLEAAARRVLPQGARLESVTAARGFPYIATRAESQVAGAIALDMLAERHGSYDAAIIAAFGDPGLGAARELFSVPVIGMAEAGMLAACMLGQRFSIVTFAAALGPWYRECVAWHGLTERCTGVRTLDNAFGGLATVQDERAEQLVESARLAVEEDGADVIVLGGAPLAGLASRVADRIPVPVVDCIGAAVWQASMLHALQPGIARSGSFARPLPKTSTGLDPHLGAWIAHEPPGS